MDVREKGSDGESEGVLQFVGKSHGEDVPGSVVGDNLVLNAFGLVSFCLLFDIHE